MKTSQKGIDLIKRHEGFRPRAYRCPVGVLTIGYGHTKGVKVGDVISLKQADEYLRQDLSESEKAVSRLVKQPLTQGQFDALVSFVVNFGETKFASSTLLRQLNAGDKEDAARQFLRWNKGEVNGKLVVLPGLVARRADEVRLFIGVA